MIEERQKKTLQNLIMQNQAGIEKLAREDIPEEDHSLIDKIRRFITRKKGETPEVGVIMA